MWFFALLVLIALILVVWRCEGDDIVPSLNCSDPYALTSDLAYSAKKTVPRPISSYSGGVALVNDHKIMAIIHHINHKEYHQLPSMSRTNLINALHMQQIRVQMDASLAGRMILDGMGNTFCRHIVELGAPLSDTSLLNSTLSDLKHNTDLSLRTEYPCPLLTYLAAKMSQ